MSHHPLDYLPPELWEVVASYLNPEDIYNFADACPFWYDLLMERRMLPIAWLCRSNGAIPKFAFCGVFRERQSGRIYNRIRDRDGIDSAKKVFVVRASPNHGELPHWAMWTVGMNTGSIPGRLHNGKRAAYVSYGCREFRKEDYQVLISPPDALEWVQTEGGNIPQHALVGGKDPNGDPYHISRIPHNGITTVGKVHQRYKLGYVAYHGKEHEYSKYEILVKTELGRELKYIYE